ncbi:MAG: hypothetical protein EOO70_02605 [Myxococcaceae bacterium]|nr:MAG: hypothetical protein EOO70_02605 [Myxococcaceae bacterium]
MPRTLAEKVYDKARSKSLEDIALVYPELWEFLLAKKVEEYRSPEHPIQQRYGHDQNKVYDKARCDAKADLRELRAGAWFLLMWGWTNHFRDELGFVPEPQQHARNNQGRFASVS